MFKASEERTVWAWAYFILRERNIKVIFAKRCQCIFLHARMHLSALLMPMFVNTLEASVVPRTWDHTPPLHQCEVSVNKTEPSWFSEHLWGLKERSTNLKLKLLDSAYQITFNNNALLVVNVRFQVGLGRVTYCCLQEICTWNVCIHLRTSV